MLIRKEKTTDDGLLGVWRIAETKDDLLKMMPPSLRVRSMHDIASFRTGKRILEWLCTRCLLFQLLGEDKEIDYQNGGRPFLTDNSYHISISHTKGYVAILLHKTKVVGIDIETISERVNKVAHKFISPQEYIDETQATAHKLLHWSAKESLFKLIEERDVDFKEHLVIQPFTPCVSGKMLARVAVKSPEEDFLVHYEVRENYVLTWVVSQK